MSQQALDWIKALIIDDSQSILSFVGSVLEQEFSIENYHQASSAPEALHLLKQFKDINLILLDLHMPNIDGVQVLEKLSRMGYKGYLIIMSGVGAKIISSVEELAKEHKLNYIGTIFKPIDIASFHRVFSKLGAQASKQQDNSSLKVYEIVRAIKNNQIEVVYQPQISLQDRAVFGVEALCRLDHPRLGLVSPDAFIEKAEESDLIVHITLLVLKRTIKDWKAWQQQGFTVKLSVNVSPAVLQQPEFADIVIEYLQAEDMPCKHLCLEVTETTLNNNPINELTNLNRLKMQGIELALDDFGKGHASVDRLQKLPLSILKLDKSYFLDKQDSVGQYSQISSTIALARQLQTKTIAEGIESAEGLNLATEIGCDFAQGYYISKPMDAEDVLGWATKWNANT